MNKKGNLGVIVSLSMVAVAFVVFIATLGVGGTVIGDLGTGAAAGSALANATTDGGLAVDNMSGKAPLLSTVIILGAILAVIGGLLVFGKRR